MAPYFGVCYGARRINQPTRDSVDGDMKLIVQRGFPSIRIYGVSGPDQWNIDRATANGLEIEIGVWAPPGGDWGKEIGSALNQAIQAKNQTSWQGNFHLVIGNEVNRADAGVYKPSEIKSAIELAQNLRNDDKYKGLTCKVTSCFSATVLHDSNTWDDVVKQCDESVLLTVYPYYGQTNPYTPGNIDGNMDWSWNNGLEKMTRSVKDGGMGKLITIAEIGWPTAEGGGATIFNQHDNYNATRKYLNDGLDSKGNPTKLGPRTTFWFEMFDEPWKWDKAKPWESHFGIYDKDAKPKW